MDILIVWEEWITINLLTSMANKKNFQLIIEYDGTNYHGWQRQKSKPTIQQTIEEAIFTMTREKVSLIGSGRTDAGVHALGQAANFISTTQLNELDLFKGLNSLLPSDIIIRYCMQISTDFHSRYCVKDKIYDYRILNHILPSAIGRQYAWHIRKKLDIHAMRSAIKYVVGFHDFKAFEASGSPRMNSTRHIYRAGLKEKADGLISIEIQANGFLRFMVRNIVGTLVDVGKNKISPDEFHQVLISRDRNLAGATAPAHGLFLVRVNY